MPAGFGPIAGLKIGHAQDDAALTGCTVLLCEAGMVAACDVCGGAVGERELATLRPGHIVEKIHALVFAGGSAFGLDAASGVMRWCEERGVGFDTGAARVPIVPAAILFDLRLGDAKRRPDAAMGYAAAEAAARAADGATVAEGNVGAGTGCSVGKLFGIQRAMKSGLGCWTENVATDVASGGMAAKAHANVRVAALAAVNAFGDVSDPETGKILAGALLPDAFAALAPGGFAGLAPDVLPGRATQNSLEFADTARAMQQGHIRRGFHDPSTVLVGVATDAALSRIEAERIAVMASAGVARAISPAHTTFDGDIVFALSCGKTHADLNALGAAAAVAVARAIVRSVTQARPAAGLPSVSSL